MKSESRTTIFDHCVGLAIAGRSFSLFDDPDMQVILRCALSNKEETTTINRSQVRAGVSRRAKEMRQQIIGRLKNRRLSLSADFASRNGVDFLGNNSINHFSIRFKTGGRNLIFFWFLKKRRASFHFLFRLSISPDLKSFLK